MYEWNVIIAPILWFMIIMFACFAFLAKCWLKINKNIGVNKQLIRWPIVFSNSFTLNYSNTALWTIPNFGIGSRTHKNDPVSKKCLFCHYMFTMLSSPYQHHRRHHHHYHHIYPYQHHFYRYHYGFLNHFSILLPLFPERLCKSVAKGKLVFLEDQAWHSTTRSCTWI